MKKICFVFLLLLTLIPLGVSAQQQMIQGRVLDDKGESIIGASVSVRGTVTGGITNLDGEFSVAGKVGDMLTISYIGYTPLEVKITKLTGNVYTLKEDSELLEEVVVVGMDKQKRNTITAAVATVKSEAITSRPVTDLTSALQGNVAGLNFASDAAADGVGGDTRLVLQGGMDHMALIGVHSLQGNNPAVLNHLSGCLAGQPLQGFLPAGAVTLGVHMDADPVAPAPVDGVAGELLDGVQRLPPAADEGISTIRTTRPTIAILCSFSLSSTSER